MVATFACAEARDATRLKGAALFSSSEPEMMTSANQSS